MNKSWETFEIGMSDLKCKGNILVMPVNSQKKQKKKYLLFTFIIIPDMVP